MTSHQRRAFDVAQKLIILVAGTLGVLSSAIALTDNSMDEFITIPAMSLSRDGLFELTAVVFAGFWFLVAFTVRTFLRLHRSEANSTQYHAAIPRDVETGGPMENEKPVLPSPGCPPFTYSPPLPPTDNTITGTCIACDMTFTSADQLTAHTAASHSGWRPSLPSPYKCIDCWEKLWFVGKAAFTLNPCPDGLDLQCNPSLIRKLQHKPRLRPRGRREAPRHEGLAHERAHCRHLGHEGGRLTNSVVTHWNICVGGGGVEMDPREEGRGGYTQGWSDRVMFAPVSAEAVRQRAVLSGMEMEAVWTIGLRINQHSEHSAVAEAYPKLVSSSGDV
ncbi:hypothetical protein C8F01DRAFT_1238473 [Mycena amicta]|nr:hypothetical protein C8F01DRAFT_1238473 [Mycena amicta]